MTQAILITLLIALTMRREGALDPGYLEPEEWPSAERLGAAI